MVTRTVAHALVRWTDPDGRRHIASHGQSIDVDEDTAAELDATGATTIPATEEVPQSPGEGTREDKRARITEALKTAPELSNRRHADAIGVDHKTVGAIRKALEDSGEIPHPDQISPPAPVGDIPNRPRPAATTAKWVAYAIARGIDRTEAEAATKDQLIEAINHLDEQDNHHG